MAVGAPNRQADRKILRAEGSYRVLRASSSSREPAWLLLLLANMTRNRILILVPLLTAACFEPSPAPDLVDHGDGTYSMSAAEGRDRSTTIRSGKALTWSYVGQARHSWEPKPMAAHDDSNHNQLSNSGIKVVRWDGVTSAPLAISNMFVDAQYSPTWDPKDDWALLS